MNSLKKEFIKKYCKNCKEKCEEGIVQINGFIRCVDKDITEQEQTFLFKTILEKLGFSKEQKGYYYILDAMEILDHQKIHTEMQTIYEMIYKKENKARTITSVETAIKKAINESFETNKAMKSIYKKVPSNSDFLYSIYFKREEIFKIL